MVSLSEVCHAIFGQREDARPLPDQSLWFSSPLKLMNLTHGLIQDSFSFFLPLTCSTLPVKSLNNLFLDHFCVDRPAALECNLNNICILCCILYKTLALSPSFWAFNHWALGGCGYLLFEAFRRKKGRESRGEWGCGKNLPPNTMYSTENRRPRLKEGMC